MCAGELIWSPRLRQQACQGGAAANSEPINDLETRDALEFLYVARGGRHSAARVVPRNRGVHPPVARSDAARTRALLFAAERSNGRRRSRSSSWARRLAGKLDLVLAQRDPPGTDYGRRSRRQAAGRPDPRHGPLLAGLGRTLGLPLGRGFRGRLAD